MSYESDTEFSESDEWDFSVTWYIENFLHSNLSNEEGLFSPMFTVDAFDNKKWFLGIFPKGSCKSAEGYVSCVLCNSDYNSSDEKDVDIKILIKIAGQKILETVGTTQACIIRREGGIGFLRLIENNELLHKLKKCFSDTLILQCYMKKSHKTKMKEVKEEIRTRIAANKCSFEWNVLLQYLENMTRKRYFYLNTTLYQISITIPQDEVIVSVLNIKEDLTSFHHINGRISLLDSKGNEVFSIKDNRVFNRENMKETWNFPSLISKKQLLDNIKQYETEEGTVIVMCEFSLFKEIRSYTLFKQNCDSFSYLDGLVNLSDNYKKLFIDKTNSDLILRSSNNDEIRAHRSVLAAQFPVFSAMLQCDMIENRNSIVDVVDIDTKCMEYFLQFLYTGYVHDMDYEMASKLLMAAEKYQVDSLKEKCSLFLISVLSVENVCEILLLADMVEGEFLKRAALNYAAKNFLSVFTSAEMSALMKENVTLYSDVLSLVEKKYEMIPRVSSEK